MRFQAFRDAKKVAADASWAAAAKRGAERRRLKALKAMEEKRLNKAERKKLLRLKAEASATKGTPAASSSSSSAVVPLPAIRSAQ